MSKIADFHFLYPAWLWALLVIPLLWVWLRWRKVKTQGWNHLIDPALMPFVLSGTEPAPRSELKPLLIFYTLLLLSILALAGPAWEKREISVFKQQQAVVIAFDLSNSMYARDVLPSRLELARFKLIDLLNGRQGGQTGLVVFAADAFIVTPLTEDKRTVEAQMRGLMPAVMPAQGSRTAPPIRRSLDLLRQAGFSQGGILLLTDGSADVAVSIEAAREARAAGYTVSVLAVGTAEGSTIPLPTGGLLNNVQGQAVVSSVNFDDLQQIAQAGGGLFMPASLQAQDVELLIARWERDLAKEDLLKEGDRSVDIWVNAGVWLLLAILPLALLLFRRGYLAVIWIGLVPIVMMLISQPLQAQVVPATTLSWVDLWQTPDQQGLAALQSGDPETAQRLFRDSEWRATAAYRAGDYALAEQLYAQSATITGMYNYGNTLARQGKITEAIKAYERVLELDPNHEDARYNLELLKQQQQQNAEQEQQEQSENQQNQPNTQNQQNAGEQGESEQEDSANPPPAADSQNQQSQNEQSADNTDAEKSSEDQQSSEELDSPSDDANEQEETADADIDPQRQEQQQATEQWLRRIPDDPAGLWRRKFQYQYQQRGRAPQGEPW